MPGAHLDAENPRREAVKTRDGFHQLFATSLYLTTRSVAARAARKARVQNGNPAVLMNPLRGFISIISQNYQRKRPTRGRFL